MRRIRLIFVLLRVLCKRSGSWLGILATGGDRNKAEIGIRVSVIFIWDMGAVIIGTYESEQICYCGKFPAGITTYQPT